MGAGRKTHLLPLKEKSQSHWTVNCSISARNLRKNDLGGVIFGCKHSTINECKMKQLFGLPAPHFSYVKNVTPGLTLFLFNYNDRKLHGIFEAASPGQLNINPYGWTSDGAGNTPYPAQVRVRVQKQCHPLLEEEFAPIIADNYYKQTFFWFELDRTQARKLSELFLSSPRPNIPRSMPTASNWSTMFDATPSGDTEELGGVKPAVVDDGFHNIEKVDVQKGAWDVPKKEVTGASERSYAAVLVKTDTSAPEKTWISLFKTSAACDTPQMEELLKTQDLCKTFNTHTSESLPQLYEANMQWESEFTASSPKTVGEYSGEKDEEYSGEKDEEYSGEKDEEYSGETVEEYSGESESSAALNVKEFNSSDLQSLVAKLMQEIGDLKGSQSKQNLKISSLEQELVQSKLEIQQLKNQYNMLASRPVSSSSGQFEEVDFESFQPAPLSDQSIIIVGGFDGSCWLSDLNNYSPSCDVLNSLSPMTFLRSYASAAKLNDELYLFGGVHGDVWYDTVESYNPTCDQWFTRPSLNQKKGSLAGVSLVGKLFAVGGGNGVECCSEVEMLDLNIGKWIFTQSMQQKRFAPAVADINGALYVAGGYDGRDYLNSVERFDPREHKWSSTGSMITKRGCHSLIALNGKLYALGGYDGKKLVSTVEIFDPRVGSWMWGDSMKDTRGYSGAVTIGEKIYVFGGLKERDEILDTIECYKEGYGWQVTNLKSLGKRCFFSALVL